MPPSTNRTNDREAEEAPAVRSNRTNGGSPGNQEVLPAGCSGGSRGSWRKGRIPLILYTDEKSDYRRDTVGHQERLRRDDVQRPCRHHTTSSRDGRNQKNPLFAVNYFDREIRKDMACQARETVQFPRNVSNAMLRMSLYMFDHNIRKPYRIRDRDRGYLRHAMVAGMDGAGLQDLVAGFFSRRVFRPIGVQLSESAERTAHRRWQTPLKVNPEKRWKYLTA
jgi:hypothetical protein